MFGKQNPPQAQAVKIAAGDGKIFCDGGNVCG
jgi:hypothetical protein